MREGDAVEATMERVPVCAATVVALSVAATLGLGTGDLLEAAKGAAAALL